MTSELKAWCNDDLGEVVAAHSAEEAREVLLRPSSEGGLGYDAGKYSDYLDSWKVLPADQHLREEDGTFLEETVGDNVQKAGKPQRLWSFEP